jgi:hypothetical protein
MATQFVSIWRHFRAGLQIFVSVLLVGSFSFVASGQSCDPAETLLPPETISAGPQRLGVALGDVNNDGHLDIVNSATGDQTSQRQHVVVILNNGDGTYSSEELYLVGNAPTHVDLGDLNGDGYLDIAVGNFFGSSLSVLMNNGDGSYSDQAVYQAGGWPSFTCIVDTNSDSYLDVLVLNRQSGTLGVFINDGAGVFADQVEYPVGFEPTTMTLADVDKNGLQDVLAISPSLDTAFVLKNVSGIFTAPEPVLVGDSPTWIESADFNGDGFDDIVTTNRSGDDLCVLLNNADGSFGLRQFSDAEEEPIGIAICDLNGDGAVDIMVGNRGSNFNSARTISIFMNTGEGEFEARHNISADRSAIYIAAGDINGDGAVDLVSTSSAYQYRTSVMYNQCQGASCPADFTGDDSLDIFDVLAFIEAYNAEDPIADFTGDGSFDIFDVLAFIEAYNAGCL